jgi:uncharacterized protein YqgQ
MKTKSFLFVIALISTVVILSSFKSESGKRVSEKQKVETQSDTLVFSPEKIGVTKLVKEFTPYPKYDGGTGIKVSFSIGIEYKGKTYQVDVRGDKFFSENTTKEKAENDPSILDLISAYGLVLYMPKDLIDVVVVKVEVIKLTKRSVIIGNKFFPTEIIWVKK